MSSVGTLQCGAFGLGYSPTSVEDIILQNYQSTLLVGNSLSVVIPSLTPATGYAIYCTTASRQGVKLSLAKSLATRSPIFTLCCKTILVSITQKSTIQGSDMLNAISVSLDALPSTNISLVLSVTRPDQANAILIPSQLTFASSHPQKSALLSVPAQGTKVLGWASVSAYIDGPAAAEFDVAFAGERGGEILNKKIEMCSYIFKGLVSGS